MATMEMLKLEARWKDGTLITQSFSPDYYGGAGLVHASEAAAWYGGIVGPYRETITKGERVVEEWDWDGNRPIRMRRWRGKRPGRWTSFAPPVVEEPNST